MVFGVISDIMFDHFEQLVGAMCSEMVPQMVLRMDIKSARIRTWNIFGVKMVPEVLRDTFLDHFEIS